MKLEYQVSTVGFDQLKRSMRSIDDEAKRLARQAERREANTVKSRQRAVRSDARVRISDEERVAKAKSKIQQTQIREAEKQDRYWRTQHSRAMRDRMRMQEREHTQRQAMERRSEALQVRETRRMEAFKVRSAAQLSRRLEREEAKAARIRQSTAGRITRGAGRVVGGVAGAVGTGLRVLGGAAAIGGTLAIGNAVSTQMSEAAMASRLANQANQPGIKGQLLKEAQGVRGFTGGEALSGLTSFVDLTGDLETARKLLPQLAELSMATGTALDDAAAAAGNFSNTLKSIQDPAKRAEAVMEAMRALGGQGQAGAIELRNLAGGGATIAAVAGQMGGDRVHAIKSAGVLAQAARAEGGADSADEALTATARFADAVVNKADKLEALGVNAVNRDKSGAITSIRDPRQWLGQFFKKTKGDLGTINDIFDIRGGKVVRGFANAYQQNGEAGVNARFDELMKTEMGRGQISTNAASRYEDTDVQFKESLKQFNAVIGEKLLPELTKLVPKFAELTPAIGTIITKGIELAGWFADNPIKGAFAVVGTLIAKEIAAAAISSVVSSSVEKLLAIIAGKAAGGALADAATGSAGNWLKSLGTAGAGGAVTSGGALATVGTVGAAALIGLGGAYYGVGAINETEWAKQKHREAAKQEMATADRDKRFQHENWAAFAGADKNTMLGIQNSLGVNAGQAGPQGGAPATVQPLRAEDLKSIFGEVVAEQKLAAREITSAAREMKASKNFNPITR